MEKTNRVIFTIRAVHSTFASSGFGCVEFYIYFIRAHMTEEEYVNVQSCTEITMVINILHNVVLDDEESKTKIKEVRKMLASISRKLVRQTNVD